MTAQRDTAAEGAMPHRDEGKLEHVEQPKGFGTFTYNVVDGRPSCVRADATAGVGAQRKGLSVSDGNKRVCPTPEVTGARRKRPAPARDRVQSDAHNVTAARPHHTPESFARRGASAPVLVVRAKHEPIDLTNVSSGSEDGGDSTSHAPQSSPSAEIKGLRMKLADEQRAKQCKQQLNDELKREVQKLLRVIETMKESLEASEAAAKTQALQLQDESAATIASLERRLADAAAARTALVGTFGDDNGAGSAVGRKLLQTYVRHLSQRLAEVIHIDVPGDTEITTSEGGVACAEKLAVGLANLISELRAAADSAAHEASEERKAREHVDAALVRAGQTAEATASAQLSAQQAHLEAEKTRQVWDMQQAMATMKGTAKDPSYPLLALASAVPTGVVDCGRDGGCR